MSDMQNDDGGPLMAWQSFLPLPDSARHEEDVQGALRGDMNLVEEAQKKASAWMDRRRVAFETGMKALSDMAACKDPASAAAIWGSWLSGNLNLMAADLSDAQDFALKAAAAGQQTVRAIS
jgi:phasin protein